MNDLNFEQMLRMQSTLQARYKDIWDALTPDTGAPHLLWLYGELAEVGDIIKKKGAAAVMEDASVHHDFIEEMCDVMMYFNDVMLCFGITPDELTTIYREKHERNMKRWKVPSDDAQ